MAEHAYLSPSAAKRWMACPGSPRMESAVPSRTSQASDEGTALHKLLSAMLAGEWSDWKVEAISVENRIVPLTDEMRGWVKQVYDWVVKYAEAHPHCSVYSEERVHVAKAFAVPPDALWGTADVVISTDEELVVLDAKFGMQEVVPDENPQLLLYAAGLMSEYGWLHDRVRLVIHQPREGGAKEKVYTAAELQDRMARFQIKIHDALIPNAPLIPSDEACQWCAAAGVCPERQKAALALAEAEFKDPALLAPGDMVKLLNASKAIRGALDAVEAHARDLLLSGATLPGWKLVESDKRRVWKDEGSAQVFLEDKLGYTEDDYAPRKMITPAQAEKLVGKKSAAALQPFITTPKGEPVLAPESDERPNWDPGDDFKGLVE